MLVVIRAIAHDKFIRDLKAAVIRFDIHHTAFRLVQKRTQPDAGRLSHLQDLDQCT